MKTTQNLAEDSVNGRASGHSLPRLVRAVNRWVTGIPMLNLGVAFGLIAIGDLQMDAGNLFLWLWCTGFGVTVYIVSPRPNVKAQGVAREDDNSTDKGN